MASCIALIGLLGFDGPFIVAVIVRIHEPSVEAVSAWRGSVVPTTSSGVSIEVLAARKAFLSRFDIRFSPKQL
jgi:hypothetical protein